MHQMKKVNICSAAAVRDTVISNIFIDGYMKNANGEFVKVYLYLIRHVSCEQGSLSLCSIADSLNLTENDVIRALRYWSEHDVLNVTFDENGAPASIVINDLSAPQAAAAAETVCAPVKSPASSSAASFSRAEFEELSEREDIKQLLYIVEKYIGAPLSPTDVRTILYIRETLGMSSELIEYLVEYCVSNEHTSLRYMEKVAINWTDQGISTVDAAKDASTMYSKRTLPVMKAFGLSDRNLTPAELDFINRWYDEYGFDKEMITEACRRTILSMGKPNFSYTDGILRKWKTAGVHTPAELKVLDAGFRAKITVPVTAKAPAPAKTNKFNNFSQRTYNFDELEKKLLNNDK